ncbi:hypothetical protein EJD97_023609, partial [Solanum chilense]
GEGKRKRRGRGLKTPIMTVGSSVGARVEVIEEVHDNSDLEDSEGENKVDGNGTVTEDNSNKGDFKGEKSKDYKEPWVNMFKNNRATNNGMNLTYFPPQIVNGQTMVQLEGKEVQIEEEKWKCALIAYVIGECPGYNIMNRYILMN